MSEIEERGHYTWPLKGQIATLLTEFEDDREGFLQRRGDGADWDADRRLLGHVEDLAKYILRGARDFVAEDQLPEEPKAFQAELEGHLREIKRHREQLLNILQQRMDRNPLSIRNGTRFST